MRYIDLATNLYKILGDGLVGVDIQPVRSLHNADSSYITFHRVRIEQPKDLLGNIDSNKIIIMFTVWNTVYMDMLIIQETLYELLDREDEFNLTYLGEEDFDYQISGDRFAYGSKTTIQFNFN